MGGVGFFGIVILIVGVFWLIIIIYAAAKNVIDATRDLQKGLESERKNHFRVIPV